MEKRGSMAQRGVKGENAGGTPATPCGEAAKRKRSQRGFCRISGLLKHWQRFPRLSSSPS